MPGWAIVLSCHGTVERTEDIPAFVRNIRRGRPAPDHVIEEVTRRFELIGGSPLMRITRAQAAHLERRLGVPVRAAGRLWHPYPAEVLAPLRDAGVSGVVSLPLAPQSVHVYHPVVERAAAELGLETRLAPSWGTRPELAFAFAEAIEETVRAVPGSGPMAILMTAHSLPSRVIAAGDPYERDFVAMAEAVGAELARRGLGSIPRAVAFQSQGIDGGDWLGPDLEQAFTQLRAQGIERLVISPIGFLAEHVETLYDIDVEAAARARALGFAEFARMPAMDVRPAFLAALEAVARDLLPD